MTGKESRNNYEKARKIDLLKKTAITSLIGIGLTFNVAYANEDASLETVYHVYVDGEHIGTIDNKEPITSYIDEQIAAKEKENDAYSYAAKQDISYVPERVFHPNTKNKEVLQTLEDELTLEVEAYQMKIGDNAVGSFKDKETAEQALRQYKAKYVDEEVLEQLEQLSSDEQDNENDSNKKDLQVGDSATLDVTLSKEVTYHENKVPEDKVLTADEGEELLEKGTLEDKVHEVQEGEVLGSIASKYNLDMAQLLELNPSIEEDTVLQIGQELHVTAYAPFVNVIVKKEEVVEEEIAYEKEVQESEDMYKGDSKVTQEGADGTKEVHYSLELVNGQVKEKEVVSEKVTKEPVKEIVVKGTKVVPSRGSGDMAWPAVGGYISSHMGSRWGSYHKGIDIAGPSNRAILAADNGTVVSAGYTNGGYGNKIVINHNNGYQTTYAHLASISVSVGQTVTKGSEIGVMGDTGRSTGIHLHFEVHKNGELVNPEDLL
ncbi:M23 family metallopeptidase [Paraliobacillus ryukyuensis]|uniref:M23 family metallopeptidase n=1 Tax=Paraliobacillus ryukyuensis TaxID=200904 RepID=UPI0009A7248B|nr:M23 family metallopeptidase [Paraliobacillus ryukyuensis]